MKAIKSFLNRVILMQLSILFGAIFYADKAKGVTPAANHDAGTAVPNEGTRSSLTAFVNGVIVAVEAKLTVTAAATNDIIVAIPLPAYHVPVDCILCADNIDTGAALTLTVAELNQDFTDIEANTNFITASTVGQAGGVARASVVDGLRLPPVARTRWIGVKVAAGAAGIEAGAVLSLVLMYRAANDD